MCSGDRGLGPVAEGSGARVIEPMRQLLRSPAEVPAVLQTLAELAREQTAAGSGWVQLVEQDQLRTAAVAGAPELAPGYVATLRGTLSEQVMTERQAVLVTDLASDPRARLAGDVPTGTRCLLLAPLHDQGPPLGVLLVASPTAGAFSQRHLELLSQLAQTAAIRLADASDGAERGELRARCERSEQVAQAMLLAIEEGALIYDRTGRMIDANPVARRLLGLGAEVPAGITILDPRWQAVQPDLTPWPVAQRPTARALATGKVVRGELAGLRLPGQELRWLRVSSVPWRWGGELAGTVTTFVDITEQRTPPQRSDPSDAQLRLLADTSSDAITRHSLDHHITWASRSTARIFGADADRLVGAPSLVGVHPDDVPTVSAALELAVRQDPDRNEAEPPAVTYRVRHGGGYEAWVESVIRVVRDPGTGAALELQCSSRDVTARMQLQHDLARQAFTDPLTGLANRTRLASGLAAALARLARRGGAVALLLVDLDGFKAVNDALGHAAGDAVLVDVAARLKGQVRAEDTLVRFGGDEFLVVIEPPDGRVGAEQAASRIVAAMSLPFPQLEGFQLPIGASVGVALTADPAVTAGQLQVTADAALYRAKARGGATVEVVELPGSAAGEVLHGGEVGDGGTEPADR